MSPLATLAPLVIGLVLVVVGVVAHDPTVRDVGIGFLGGGVTTGSVHATNTRRV